MTIGLVVTIGLVAIAGAAGAVVRFLVDRRLNDEFPIGTLAVNLVASFALGLITGADDPITTVVGIGALGALSTWATAANEAATMSREGKGALAIGYLGLTVTTGVLAAWFGLKLSPLLF